MSHWHNGFPQCPGCSMPLALCFCGRGKIIIAERAKEVDAIAEIGRNLWRELFINVESVAQLQAWREKIPNYDCKCRDFYDKFAQEHPPSDVNGQIPFRWKWALKSAVNQKLGHPDLTLEEAQAFWASQT